MNGLQKWRLISKRPVVMTMTMKVTVPHAGNDPSLRYKLVPETVDGRTWVVSNGSPILVAPGISGIRKEQSRGQFRNVGLPTAIPWVPPAFLEPSGKVQEEGVQKDVEVTLNPDQPLQHDPEDGFPPGTRP